MNILVAGEIALALVLLINAGLKHYGFDKPARPDLYRPYQLALLGVVTVLACWFPARRATRVNRRVALREE